MRTFFKKSPHFTFYLILNIFFKKPLANRGSVSTITFIKNTLSIANGLNNSALASSAKANAQNGNKYTFYHRNYKRRKEECHHKSDYETKNSRYKTISSDSL